MELTKREMCGVEPFAEPIIASLGVEHKKQTAISVELVAKFSLEFFGAFMVHAIPHAHAPQTSQRHSFFLSNVYIDIQLYWPHTRVNIQVLLLGLTPSENSKKAV
ncbi:hypothetical protein BDQ17DRAFT_1334894 [Cyathus striatus]|nr:hypothetical protein BDQ17DRAFT_1334894 [Cyathus striatus]